MKYEKQFSLKNGKTMLVRNAAAADAEPVLRQFLQTHAETDYLLTYPEENSITAEQEAEYLQKAADSSREAELLAVLDGKVVGSAGIEAVGTQYKLRHRAEFGISVLKEYWGLGIGRALTLACIECAETAGYGQLELTVVSENTRAAALYKSVGFAEYGRNPKGFKSKTAGFQETVHMRLEL